MKEIITLIDDALALAPGTRQDHLARQQALNMIVQQLKANQDEIERLKAELAPTPAEA